MKLTELPDDVLHLVFDRVSVNTRAMCCLASTCRKFRDWSRERQPLNVVVAGWPRMIGASRWLEIPHVSRRVETVTARRSAWGTCMWLRALSALRRLTISFSSVTSLVFANVSERVEHVDIHCVRPTGDNSHFYTDVLSHLHRLHTLRITFAPEWDMVVVRRLPQRFSEFTLRRGPYVLVTDPPMAETFKIEAEDGIAWDPTHCLWDGCKHIDIDALTVPSVMFSERPTALETLILRTASMFDSSVLRRMPNLRSLHLDLPFLILTPAELPAELERLEVAVEDALGASGPPIPRPASLTRVRFELGGVASSLDSLVFSG